MALAKGGGQNRKETKKRGRPADLQTTIIDHLETTAPLSLFPAMDRPEHQLTEVSCDLSCPICCIVLDRPLQLACGNVVCFDCCYKYISSATSRPITCLCCYHHHLEPATISAPPSMVLNLLSGLLVTCGRGCGRLVRANLYIKHCESKCVGFYHQEVNSPSKMTLRDVLSKPTNLPPTPVEKKVTQHLVRRLLDESPQQVIRVPTRGQVSAHSVHSNSC